MIKIIKVNGFRTFSDFKLELNQGLNLLVGPNGGGKSTLMMFFSLLEDIYTSNLSSAVSNLGGAGKIFRKVGALQYERLIEAEVFGAFDFYDIEDRLSARDRNRIKLNGNKIYYKYNFQIELTEDREDVYFKHQEFSIKQTNTEITSLDRISVWELVFKVDYSDKNIRCYGLQNKELQKKFDFLPFRLKKQINDRDYIELENSVYGDGSLMHIARYFDSTIRYGLSQDFSKGIIYNPQPDLIRKNEDSAKSPGIRSDGTGLYSTLLALKRRKAAKIGIFRSIDRRFFRPKISYAKLIEYYKFAFPSLHSVEVTNDPFDNQIRARVTLDSSTGIQLPLSALSDGTLKWMSLVTALLTNRTVKAIEEPENFIHPAVQKQAIELVRESIGKNSFVLVSTHSQSVLDAALPEELIFITLKNSKTRADRVKYPEKIKDLIYESGFNLSFYYMSGVLENA